jgi:ubiquinone/menaquinone biosynthesis C-methylase UbiE
VFGRNRIGRDFLKGSTTTAKPSAPGDAAAITRHFDQSADDYAAAYERNTNSGYSFRIRKQRVLELFDKPGGAVLDAGCGPGVVVDELVRGANCKFWGVDASHQMISRANQRYAGWPRVHFEVGRVEELRFPSESFDAVLAMGVLEYLADSASAASEMYRVLRPGGTLIVTLPNAQSPFRIWSRVIWQPVLRCLQFFDKWVPALQRLASVHHREFRFSSHRRVYEELGASIEDVVYYNFKPFPSPFDLLLRPVQLRISSRLERYCRSRARFLGTGFIIKVRKPPN